MIRKRDVFLTIFLFLIFLTGFVYAQNETASITDENGTIAGTSGVTFIDEDAQLGETEGITPDSALYFVDEFFDKFGDDSSIREEKIAEIKVMIQEGKIEEARIALENYREYAGNLEEDVGPEESEEARRSAAAIYNALLEIEDEIPEDAREEFFDDVIEREEAIVTAAEIANKIKELCETLSKLDPLEYSRVCRIENNAPEWQKNLDRELTDEQRQEAIKFGEIMSECFETSGQQCRCEEIPFTEFSEMCSVVAPLAIQCDIGGDEEACEKLDNLEMPELPSHLQDVFDRLEGGISEAQFDLHMPRECQEAGATNPEECRRIMIQTNAPEECREALLSAEVKNEREAREICEKIMFELNAPEECIEAGLTDSKECGKLMFELNAPEECIEAGLTGENRGDEKKCRAIMEESRDGREQGFRGPEGGFGGANCRGITDSEERLRCYDSASQGAREHYEERREEQFEERFREGVRPPEEFREQPSGGEFSQPPSEEYVPPPESGLPSGGESTTSSGGEATTTGAVIFNDRYSNYYFR